jgi:hypothetical protein
MSRHSSLKQRIFNVEAYKQKGFYEKCSRKLGIRFPGVSKSSTSGGWRRSLPTFTLTYDKFDHIILYIYIYTYVFYIYTHIYAEFRVVKPAVSMGSVSSCISCSIHQTTALLVRSEIIRSTWYTTYGIAYHARYIQ